MEPDYEGPMDFENTPSHPPSNPSRAEMISLWGLILFVAMCTIGVPVYLTYFRG